MKRTASLIPALLLPLLLIACAGEKGRPLLSVEQLASYSWLPATIEGDTLVSYMTDDTCHYSEWAQGPFSPDGNGTFEAAHQTTDSILIVTPHGVLPIDVFSIRLYLRPTFSRTFSPENSSIAPLPVQKYIDARGDITAVREYVLRPHQTYYARVSRDSMSTRGADSDAGEQVVLTRAVVEISDRPFDASREWVATPATRTE